SSDSDGQIRAAYQGRPCRRRSARPWGCRRRRSCRIQIMSGEVDAMPAERGRCAHQRVGALDGKFGGKPRVPQHPRLGRAPCDTPLVDTIYQIIPPYPIMKAGQDLDNESVPRWAPNQLATKRDLTALSGRRVAQGGDAAQASALMIGRHQMSPAGL